MSTEQKKSEAELAAFTEFAQLSGLPIELNSVEKRPPPEPDLRCLVQGEGLVAFELVELCDPNLARAIADPRPDGNGVEYIRTSDPSWQIMRKKLRRRYTTEHPIELLCYTDGRIITPTDIILPTIKLLLASFRHSFRRAWLLSKGAVYQVWN